MRARDVEDLGQDVERDHAEQHTGGEGEDVVQAVSEPEREQPAGQGRDKGRERKQDRGHRCSHQ